MAACGWGGSKVGLGRGLIYKLDTDPYAGCLYKCNYLCV